MTKLDEILAEATKGEPSNGLPAESVEQVVEQPNSEPETVEQTETPSQETVDDPAKQSYEYQSRRLQSLADKIENMQKTASPEEIEELIELNKALKQGLAGDLKSFIETRVKPKNVDDVGIEIPVKPESFDMVESVTDENSDSFKYRVAMEDYRLQRQEARIMRKIEESKQKEIQATENKRTMEDLKSRHGFDDAGINELTAFISNPETYTTENMVKFYQMLKGQKVNPTGQKISSEMAQIQRNAKLPQPSVLISGKNQPTETPERKFVKGIVALGNSSVL